MFLGFIAFAVAFFAVLRNSELADRVKKLEADRDDLLLKVRELQRLGERTAGRAGPTVPRPADTAATPPLPVTTAAPVEATHEAARPVPVATDVGPTPDASRIDPPAPGLAVKPETVAPEIRPAPARPTPPPVAPIALEPPAPPIDWESLLGVKGAAWVGGIALIASAIFFARWTIEQGYITPELRFAFMIFGGIGALIAAEIGLRRGYERTANPLSGAGIAILYIAFYAGHTRYELISMPMAFIGMVFVTMTACVLAIRYDAFPTAVLGLLGGFVTPLALSTGEDRPVGLFSYILLLNVGLIAVGAKRRWPGLFELGLIGTFFIQIGWFSKFMSPANLLVGVVSFTVFGVMYLLMPLASKEETNDRVLRTGAVGGLVPFLFAMVLAGSPEYVEQWPLLFGMMALLDLALLAFAVKRGRVGLLLSGAIATAVTLTVWAAQGLKVENGASLFGSTLFAIALAAIFGVARRVAERFGDLEDKALRTIEIASVFTGIGLGLFGLIMIGHDRGAPAGPFLMLATALALLILERAGYSGRITGVLSVGSLGLATLIQMWFFASVDASTLTLYLTSPAARSLLLTFFASRDTGGTADNEAEVAVRLASWMAIFGLLVSIAQDATGATGWPLFVALALHSLVIVGSVLRSDWTIGLPALLGATAFHVLVWQLAQMKAPQHDLAFVVSILFYFGFVALPMIVPFVKWREAMLPWFTSALAGPVFFLPLYNVFKEAFGESAIGLLPLAMAVVSLVALRVVSARFEAVPNDELRARLRLRYLALFTAVVFWFIALAIPLQLHRQWMTLAWALEATALCWLFGRLPHRGLPLFAGTLYALVGVRLLLNPEVLQYQMRGTPVFNWILYTYGSATVCCLVGQSLLRRFSASTLIHRLADAIALNGLLLGFWLVNLEIFDYFSPEAYIQLSDRGGYSVKLALSAGWGLYAIVLLVVGVVKEMKPLRYLSLAFLLLTVLKVFLYDLSELGGIFRVLSFLGLAVALILVSLFYQRFVFKKSK